MKFFLATSVLLSSTSHAFMVAPPRFHAVHALSASESEILEIVEKMPRLDAGEKANLKSLLYKAGDVHPADTVADVVVGTEETAPEPVAVVDEAKEEILVSEESSPAMEAVEVKEESVPEETPAETTLVSEEPAVESTANIAAESPVAAESVPEGDAPIQIAQSVVDSAEQVDTASQAIAGEDSNMLADLVVDVVNSSSDLVDTVSTAISHLS